MTLACMEESVSKGLGGKEAAMHAVYWSRNDRSWEGGRGLRRDAINYPDPHP